MREGIHALIVSGQATPMGQLEFLLQRRGVETSRARSCAEVEVALRRLDRPMVIFTDTVLPDVTWSDVVVLAAGRYPRVPVIVVSRFVDLDLYLDALEGGAADFLVPPFREADLAYVIEGALLHKIGVPPIPPQAISRMQLEVNRHAQDYAGAGVRTSHAQVGR